jgi:hypothetical protein
VDGVSDGVVVVLGEMVSPAESPVVGGFTFSVLSVAGPAGPVPTPVLLSASPHPAASAAMAHKGIHSFVFMSAPVEYCAPLYAQAFSFPVSA